MPPIERRDFLLFTASTLAMLGLNQLDILQKSQRSACVIAQNTPRKLALLVGINAYPFGNELAGCLTDIELQQHLLVHRFGFNPKDILVLTDETQTKPTRQNILTAFEEHLIKQAQPGDVVVFHYSGHGSQVVDPERVYKNRQGKYLNSTFVPIDNTLSLKDRQSGGTVPDITGHTLFLLMSALNTENVTVTLDCCHSGGGKRGNLTVRALDGNQLQASEIEREYQQQWLKRLNLSPEDYRRRLQTGIAKGVVIASAGIDQFAADMPFSGFKAGAFTYIMTQYLWQQTGNEALESAIANIGRSTTQVASGQNPEYEAQPNSKNNQQPIYFLNQQTPPGEAVITGVEGNEVQLWLGGVNSDSIRAFNQGAILTVVDAQGKPQGLVQLQSPRQGLSARAKPIKDTKPDVLKTGTVLQERVRVIPSDVSLRIGLDPSLGNDTAQVEPPMRGIKQLEALPVQQGQDVEYILGRITQDNRPFQKSRGEELPSIGSIGLFTPALELIPSSFGTPGESIEAAVTRLKAKFKSLLATHLVKMILNPGSSQLRVVASMSLPDSGNQIAASTFPVRGGVGQTEGIDNPPPVLANDSRKLPILISCTSQEKPLNRE